MATMTGRTIPLVVITGPTASGKSGLALELAEKFGGEIICADSRTVYRGMDIGTAKPSAQDQARVPHHLLDVVNPNERFTVHDFQLLAKKAVVEIRTRGNIPFLVGGTGLYIDSVVLDYDFPSDDDEIRRNLSDKTQEELHAMIKTLQLPMPLNSQNRRHLVQAIVASEQKPTAKTVPDAATHVVAIATDKATLEERVFARSDEMFESGVLDEARRLAKQYGWESEAMTGNIYPILREVLEGRMSQPEGIERFIIRDRQLAKRQITWLKRHNFVRWLNLDDARVYIDELLGASVAAK